MILGVKPLLLPETYLLADTVVWLPCRETVDLPKEQRLSDAAAILQADITALQSQIPFAQPEGGGSCFTTPPPHPSGFLFEGIWPPA